MPTNQWLSEACVLLTGLSLGISWSSYVTARRGLDQALAHPYLWPSVPHWRRAVRFNRAWTFVMAVALVAQIRTHLWQIGLMPMPFR